uniref:Uncharacterized protein n=2 Tax=Ursus americanus TaxID=9643 RepID=A0A452RF07_URSAM
MKGTLFVLALLVTQELGIEMVKSCPIFYTVFGSVAGGSKSQLDFNLGLVNATKPEKEALEKIQDCYNEKGLKAKVLDLDVMVISILSPHPHPEDTHAAYCKIAHTNRPRSQGLHDR